MGAASVISRIVTLHSAQARLPENGFNGNNNNGRYMSPDLDALIERFQSTIPRAERMGVATQIVRHQTEQLPLLPLVYDATAVLTANHLVHVADGSGTSGIWRGRGLRIDIRVRSNVAAEHDLPARYATVSSIQPLRRIRKKP